MISNCGISFGDSQESNRWQSIKIGQWPEVGTRSSDEVAILGHSDFMFLLRGSNAYYESYNQTQSHAAAQAGEWLSYLDRANRACQERGASFLFYVVPNKASVLPDLYPLPLGEGITPRLAALRRSLAVPNLIPLDSFRDNPGRLALFRRNDTHLTEFGNVTSVRQIVELLGYDTATVVTEGDAKEIGNAGDLGSRFPAALLESVRRPRRVDSRSSVTSLSEPTNNVVGLSYIVHNSVAPLDRTVAVFGNSFFDRYHGWGMMPVLAGMFRRVLFRWTNEIDTNLIDELRPDHVILQTCERFLGLLPNNVVGPGLPKSRVSAPPAVRGSSLMSSARPKLEMSSMKIEINEHGRIAFSGRVETPMSLWAGERRVGDVVPGQAGFPLRGLATNADAIERFGLIALSEDQQTAVTADLSGFAQHYYGADGLLRKLQALVGPGKWEVYRIGVSERRFVTANFGVVLPMRLAGVPFEMRCQGASPMDLVYTPEPHFGFSHWFMPDNAILGVRARFDIKAIEDFVCFDIAFPSHTDTTYTRHFRPIYTVTNPALLDELPDLARIQRVAGSQSNRTTFMNGGRTAFTRIAAIAERHGKLLAGRDWQVLDWGVGCGRVARHFATLPNVALVGVDIDNDNVRWCANNLRGVYHTVDLMPPAPLAEGSFDLIYSCSVLSHLTAPVADAWLLEIARVLKPNGIALLSYNGSSNLASYLGKRPVELARVLGREMFDRDVNHDLDGFIPSADYYRASFAEDWWWSKVFRRRLDLIDVEIAAVSGHQDIAVLRRKPT